MNDKSLIFSFEYAPTKPLQSKYYRQNRYRSVRHNTYAKNNHTHNFSVKLRSNSIVSTHGRPTFLDKVQKACVFLKSHRLHTHLFLPTVLHNFSIHVNREIQIFFFTYFRL